MTQALMTRHDTSSSTVSQTHRVCRLRRRAVAFLALVLSACTITLVAAAPPASATFNYGSDSATTWVYCDSVGHQIWLRSTATFYDNSMMRQVLTQSAGSSWRVLSGWRIPDNQWIVLNTSTIAGYRLNFFVQYSYTSTSGEYPLTYQWNGYTRQWVQQSTASCIV